MSTVKKIVGSIIPFLIVAFIKSAAGAPVKTMAPGSIFFYGKSTAIPSAKKVRCYLFKTVFQRRSLLDAEKCDAEDVDGGFRLSISGIGKPCYISLYVPSAHEGTLVMEYFLVHPGDSIVMDLNGSDTKFSGRGSEKYNCQFQINQLKASIFKTERVQDTTVRGIVQNEILKHQRLDWLYAVKLHTLESWKGTLQPAVYKQLYVDYLAEKNLVKYRDFHTNLLLSKPGFTRNALLQYYNSYLKGGLEEIPYQTCHYASRTCADMLAAYARLYLLVSAINSGDKPAVDAEKMLAYYSARYRGDMFRKLLVHYVIDAGKNTGDYEKLVGQALPLQADPLLIKVLNKIRKEQFTGVQAQPFNWVDSTGMQYTLSDFKGHSLVINFWLAGCGACYQMEKNMKKVRAHFKDNKKIIFLSVCAVPDRLRWLRALPTGDYSGPGSIELFTNGKAMDDAFAKYYGYAGCPSIMLIDDRGYVVDPAPVRPITEASTQSFIKQLEQLIETR